MMGVTYSLGSEPHIILCLQYINGSDGYVNYSSLRMELGYIIRKEEWSYLTRYGFLWSFWSILHYVFVCVLPVLEQPVIICFPDCKGLAWMTNPRWETKVFSMGRMISIQTNGMVIHIIRNISDQWLKLTRNIYFSSFAVPFFLISDCPYINCLESCTRLFWFRLQTPFAVLKASWNGSQL